MVQSGHEQYLLQHPGANRSYTSNCYSHAYFIFHSEGKGKRYNGTTYSDSHNKNGANDRKNHSLCNNRLCGYCSGTCSFGVLVQSSYSRKHYASFAVLGSVFVRGAWGWTNHFNGFKKPASGNAAFNVHDYAEHTPFRLHVSKRSNA
ncbi:hypothetical protein DSECCO2_520090 [anaerobic digester metagenome]